MSDAWGVGEVVVESREKKCKYQVQKDDQVITCFIGTFLNESSSCYISFKMSPTAGAFLFYMMK